MAELMVDFITSLDGFGGTKVPWPGFWGMQGPEYMAWLAEDSAGDYITLMGANTYRDMTELGAENPDEEATMDDFAKMPKIVFSSTLQPPLSWPNTRLISGDAVEVVRQMKAEGKNMRTVGSISLCRALLKAGLVDRFRVGIFPVITGSTGDDRIYEGYPDVALDMVSSRTFDGRIQLLEYIPRVLTAPPEVNSGA